MGKYELSKVACRFDNASSKERCVVLHDSGHGAVVHMNGAPNWHTQNPPFSTSFRFLTIEFCSDPFAIDQI